MGLWREIGTLARPRCRAPSARSLEALATLGLQDLANRRDRRALRRTVPARAVRAPALAGLPAIILLDEPFRAVDAKTVADLSRLISRWHDEGRTVIAALHDLEQVRAHFPKTLLLAREVVAWGETRSRC